MSEERLAVPRLYTNMDDDWPGAWWRMSSGNKVEIKCSGGHRALFRKTTVRADGTTRGYVRCPDNKSSDDTCDFLSKLRLEDWQGREPPKWP